MLGKLIKYDLLLGAKRYSILFLLLCGTWLSGLAVSLIGNRYISAAFLAVNVLTSLFFVGAYIITSLQFFYNALSGDESYFSYTIPVNTVSLVFSKLTAIWIWGAAITGALVLTWVSLNATLLSQMGERIEIPGEILDLFISLLLPQVFLTSIILAFSISLFNTPKLKSTNAGMVVVVIAAYALTQAVGILEVGLIALWQYSADAEIIRGLWANSLTSAQEISLLETVRLITTLLAALLSPLFFWLTVRTVKKHRSI